MYKLLENRRGLNDFIQQDTLDGFWLISLEGQEVNWISERFWKMLGYDHQKMDSNLETLNSVTIPEDIKTISESLLKHSEDLEFRSDITVRFRHKLGSTIWMKFRGKTIGFADTNNQDVLVAFIDVTEEKMKESFLVDCNAAANIGYWNVNFETMEVMWSPVTKEIHGVASDYEPEIETAINYFKEGTHREIVRESVNNAIEKGEGYNIEVLLVTASGEERWVNSIGYAEISKGKCIRIYGTFQDINEIKTAEIEMKSLLKVTREQNIRLQNFKSIVSHNLRSHSGNIEFMTDLLGKDRPELKDAETYKMLSSAANNLSETIHHLSEVSKMNSTDKTQLVGLRLTDFVEKTISHVSGLAKEADVQVINDFEGNHKILGFPAYLDSVLLNLMTNAIKYRSDKRESFVRIYSILGESELSLCIEDNGLGIDLMMHKDKLFGMYKTFHENKDAKGIGLFITRNQIEAMDATIDVESEINLGTVFKINFKYEKG